MDEREIFDNFIKSEGLKGTLQRVAVLDAFLGIEDHVSVDDIHRILSRDGQKVGYATVHRTMKLIAQCGLAREVRFNDGILRFEHQYKHKQHYHLVCTHCGKVIEFNSDKIDSAEKAILKRYGFTMHSHRYNVFGLCKECRKKNGKPTEKFD
jgi:Fur family ferric uptake transcriptional regulator